MYLNVIACEVMVREVCQVVATSPHICDVSFLTQGYHDWVDDGRRAIQERLDALPEGKYNAVLLGYGLCNNLIAGLTARTAPLVVPRAHDCITHLLGGKDRYLAEFTACPGTYYYSSGWLECRTRRGTDDITQAGGNTTTQYEKFVAKYGEDNARYLMETLGAWSNHYQRGALISFAHDATLDLHRRVEAICDQRGWRMEVLEGDLNLLQRWVNGDWDEADFLVVPPGRRIEPAWDGSVVKAAD